MVGFEQCEAHGANVDDADQAGVADDRQVPEMAARHDVGRFTDAGRGVDDGGSSGHHFIDPGSVHVLPVGDRVGNVRLGNDAYRLAGPGVQDRDRGRGRMLHQVGGRSHVVVLFYRGQRWAHDVPGGGRGGDVGLLGHLFHLYLCWDLGWALALEMRRFARPGCQCPRYSPTLYTIRAGLLLTAPALAVGAQVDRVAADADGVPDTAGVT